MKKHIFKAIAQSMIEASFMDFYFPDNIDHPFIHEMHSFQEKSSNYRLQLLNSCDVVSLKHIAAVLHEQISTFAQLSKEDFPGIHYFFNTLKKDDFNFEKVQVTAENNYQKSSFLQKILPHRVSIPKKFNPTASIKKAIFNDFGFQYLYVPFNKLSEEQSQNAYEHFIEQAHDLMQHMNKPYQSLSIYGQLGIYLETTTSLYGHEPKCIGFTKDINPSTLLHEWTHAIDNFVFHKLSGINHFASENTSDFPVINKKFLPAYQAIKQSLFQVCNTNTSSFDNIHQVVGSQPSVYYTHCTIADDDLFITPTDYYKQPCEILARMTESGEFNDYTQSRNHVLTNYVYLKPDQNPYLNIKDILFSSIEQPLVNIKQIRDMYHRSSNMHKSLSSTIK